MKYLKSLKSHHKRIIKQYVIIHQGLSDEVVIYDVALTEDDIGSIMTPATVSLSGKLATTWGRIKK